MREVFELWCPACKTAYYSRRYNYEREVGCPDCGRAAEPKLPLFDFSVDPPRQVERPAPRWTPPPPPLAAPRPVETSAPVEPPRPVRASRAGRSVLLVLTLAVLVALVVHFVGLGKPAFSPVRSTDAGTFAKVRFITLVSLFLVSSWRGRKLRAG